MATATTTAGAVAVAVASLWAVAGSMGERTDIVLTYGVSISMTVRA